MKSIPYIIVTTMSAASIAWIKWGFVNGESDGFATAGWMLFLTGASGIIAVLVNNELSKK